MTVTPILSQYSSPSYKSRVERDIGSLLDQYCIPFIYEKPTAVIDSGKCKIFYPDYSLSYGLLIEYFGINGEPSYRERTMHKLKVYAENQFDVLPVYPQDMGAGWQENLLRRIDTSLEHKLSDYRSRITQAVLTPVKAYSKSGSY